MKKAIGILVLLSTLFAYSQEPLSNIGISGGYTTNGFAIHASYNYCISQQEYIHAGVYYSITKDKQETVTVPYKDISLNLGVFKDIIEDRYNRYNISIGGGGILGYEIINGGDNQLDTGALINGKSQFIYGVFMGLEADYLLSDTFSIAAIVNEYYHINSDLGKLAFFGGIGLKYYFF